MCDFLVRKVDFLRALKMVIDLTEAEPWAGACGAEGGACGAEGGAIRLLSYNIDGLNEDCRMERVTMILSMALSEGPDLVLFQEVVPELFPLLSDVLGSNHYSCHGYTASLGPYFTLTFYKNTRFTSQTARFERKSFKSSSSLQGRDMLISYFHLDSTIGSKDSNILICVNLHLESCGKAFQSPNSFVRQLQLEEALQLVLQHKGCGLVGGDLNIRNEEANKVLNQLATLGHDITDAAVACRTNANTISNTGTNSTSSAGNKKLKKGNSTMEHEYTWYLPGNNKVGMRFDRVYNTNTNTDSSMEVVGYRLIGGDEILDYSSSTYRTPSDHRGLVIDYSMSTKYSNTTTASNGISTTSISSIPINTIPNSSNINNNHVNTVNIENLENNCATSTTNSTTTSNDRKRSRRELMAEAAMKRLKNDQL
jgi:exonuclease III